MNMSEHRMATAAIRVKQILDKTFGALIFFKTRSDEAEAGVCQHAKGRLTNFLSRTYVDGLRQYAKGRLTNFLSRPYVDSFGQMRLKQAPVNMPKVA